MSSSTPLIDWPCAQHGDGAPPVAWRGARPVSAGRFLADVHRVAARLPAGRHLLDLCADRYHFAVAFCAAVLAGRVSLLPPNHSAELFGRLRELYDDLNVIADNDTVLSAGLPVCRYPSDADGRTGHADGSAGGPPPGVPMIADDAVVAHVFTSGSTGLPTAHRKTWARLVYNVRSEALRLGLLTGSPTTLVGTVPAQHMYGFESTVMLGLQNRIAFNGGSPFYPADIVAALAAIPGDRVLVTTPFHLRTLLAVPGPMPAVRMIVSATAPLSPQVAREVEDRFAAPLLEIYGCTEAGQLATRRPVEGDLWQTFRGVTIATGLDADGDAAWFAAGGHIETPTALSDVLVLETPEWFRLLGRGADMVNVAGKRASLAHLNHLLCEIPGVVDGAFFNPDTGLHDVARLTAFFVSETLTERDVLAALRHRTDAVFLPRPLHRVDRLPRAATGKLPQAALAELAARCRSRREPV